MQVYSSKKQQGVAQEQDLQDPQQAAEANSANIEALSNLPPDAPDDPGIIAQLMEEEDGGGRGLYLSSEPMELTPVDGGEQEDIYDDSVTELPSTSQGTGSATVAASSGAEYEAEDTNSYTSVFLQLKRDNPDLSDDELLDLMARRQVNPGSRTGHMGENAASEGGDKVALVIGNADYTGMLPVETRGLRLMREIPDLPGAAADADAMAAQYGGDGFDVDAKDDLTGSEIGREVSSAGSGMEAGDELLIYYAGHGLRDGLVGVDYPDSELVPNATVAAAANAAVSGGYHATVMLDSCHSGSVVDLMEGAGESESPSTEEDAAQAEQPAGSLGNETAPQ